MVHHVQVERGDRRTSEYRIDALDDDELHFMQREGGQRLLDVSLRPVRR